MTGNAYTGENDASPAGVLVFGGCGNPISHARVYGNTLVNNGMGVYYANYNDACTAPAATPARGQIDNNTISNDAVSNISGNYYPQGYQAGIVDVGNGNNINNKTSLVSAMPSRTRQVSSCGPSTRRSQRTRGFTTTRSASPRSRLRSTRRSYDGSARSNR